MSLMHEDSIAYQHSGEWSHQGLTDGIIDLPGRYLDALATTGIRRPKAGLRAYGNMKLLGRNRFCVLDSLRKVTTNQERDEIELASEKGVLDRWVLVSGVATPGHQRAAVVPLRWGAPRILVVNCGMHNILGPDLNWELFRAARLWRHEFDPHTDLVISNSRDDHAGFPAHSDRVNVLIKGFATADFKECI